MKLMTNFMHIIIFFLFRLNSAVFLLWKHLDPVVLIGLPIYTVLLVTMCWRSLALIFFNAKVRHSKNILRIICAIGSVLFVISDTMIAIDKFYAPIQNSSVCITIDTFFSQHFAKITCA